MIEFVSSCTLYDFLNEQDIKIPTIYDEISSYLNYLEELSTVKFIDSVDGL